MAEPQQGDPVAEITAASEKEVSLDAGPKPVLPSVSPTGPAGETTADQGEETDEEAPEKDVGLEYLYDNDELPEEASDDSGDFDDPGEAGDDDYAEDDDEDDADDYHPEPVEQVSGKRRTAGTGSSQAKRPRKDDDE